MYRWCTFPRGFILRNSGVLFETHLEIHNQLNFDPTVFFCNESLKGILVASSGMQYLIKNVY
jgi:2-hydroxy-3-keto-5-methylthiopentenyl-1-phosphate phosphatase